MAAPKRKPASRKSRSPRARASSWSRRGSTTISPTRCSRARPRCSTRPRPAWDIITVPGSLEIVPAIAIAVDAAEKQKKPYDGVVALGCVIQGETFHFDIVSMQSARALIDFSVAAPAAVRQRHPHRRHRAAGLGARPHHRAGQGRRRRARGAGADRDQTPARQEVDVMAKAAQPNEGRRANRRGAARLAAVQALYQMDLAGDAAQRDPGASSRATGSAARSRATNICRRRPRYFRDVVRGVVDEQRRLDPMIDAALQKGWPLKRIETVLRAILRAGAYELDRKPRRAGARRGVGICRCRPCLRRSRRDRHGQCGARPARAAVARERVRRGAG